MLSYTNAEPVVIKQTVSSIEFKDPSARENLEIIPLSVICLLS